MKNVHMMVKQKQETYCKHGSTHVVWMTKRGRVKIYNPRKYGCNWCIKHGL